MPRPFYSSGKAVERAVGRWPRCGRSASLAGAINGILATGEHPGAVHGRRGATGDKNAWAGARGEEDRPLCASSASYPASSLTAARAARCVGGRWRSTGGAAGLRCAWNTCGARFQAVASGAACGTAAARREVRRRACARARERRRAGRAASGAATNGARRARGHGEARGRVHAAGQEQQRARVRRVGVRGAGGSGGVRGVVAGCGGARACAAAPSRASVCRSVCRVGVRGEWAERDRAAVAWRRRGQGGPGQAGEGAGSEGWCGAGATGKEGRKERRKGGKERKEENRKKGEGKRKNIKKK